MELLQWLISPSVREVQAGSYTAPAALDHVRIPLVEESFTPGLLISPQFVAGVTLLFFAGTFVLEWIAPSCTAVLPQVRSLSRLNNALYSLASLGMSVMVLVPLLEMARQVPPATGEDAVSVVWHWTDELVCKRPLGDAFVGPLLVYYLSKLYEYVDIVLVGSMGVPLHVHFRVHHSITPLVAWTALRVLPGAAPVAMLVNTLLHFFSYAFFSGCSIFFWPTRVLGFVQLFVGIGASVFAIVKRHVHDEPCQGGERVELFGLGVYVLFLLLFLYELATQPKQVKTQEKSKEE